MATLHENLGLPIGERPPLGPGPRPDEEIKLTEQAPLVVIVGADKGGTGKTTVTRALAGYADHLGQHPTLIDTQIPRGGLKLFYPEARLIDIASTGGMMEVFDPLPPLTVIDVRGGVMAQLVKTLGEVGLVQDCVKGSVRLALVYLLGPSVESLAEVVDAYRAIGPGLRVFFARNHVNATEYFGWEKDTRFATALESMKSTMFDVPQLDARATEACQLAGVPFQTFVSDARNNRILRGLVQHWLDNVFASFDSVGLGELICR